MGIACVAVEGWQETAAYVEKLLTSNTDGHLYQVD
jgi:hypothetical protein